MPTAVPATVPPSRLCTKFVPYSACRKAPPKVRNTGRNARLFFCLSFFLVKESIHTLPQFWTSFFNFSGPNPPKIHPGRPSRALLGHSGCGGTKECHFERFPCESLVPFGGLLGHLFAFLFLFVISMRPVLCLPKDIPKSKKYRVERSPFFFEFVCLFIFVLLLFL